MIPKIEHRVMLLLFVLFSVTVSPAYAQGHWQITTYWSTPFNGPPMIGTGHLFYAPYFEYVNTAEHNSIEFKISTSVKIFAKQPVVEGIAANFFLLEKKWEWVGSGEPTYLGYMLVGSARVSDSRSGDPKDQVGGSATIFASVEATTFGQVENPNPPDNSDYTECDLSKKSGSRSFGLRTQVETDSRLETYIYSIAISKWIFALGSSAKFKPGGLVPYE